MSAYVRVRTAVYVLVGVLAGTSDKCGLSTNGGQGGAGPQHSEPVPGGQRSQATCQPEGGQQGAWWGRGLQAKAWDAGSGSVTDTGDAQLRLEANSVTHTGEAMEV